MYFVMECYKICDIKGIVMDVLLYVYCLRVWVSACVFLCQ